MALYGCAQEKLKLEALQLVHAKEENEAKKAAEVDKLQAELAAMRDAQAEAALKMTTMQEEATRKVRPSPSCCPPGKPLPPRPSLPHDTR